MYGRIEYLILIAPERYNAIMVGLIIIREKMVLHVALFIIL